MFSIIQDYFPSVYQILEASLTALAAPISPTRAKPVKVPPTTSASIHAVHFTPEGEPAARTAAPVFVGRPVTREPFCQAAPGVAGEGVGATPPVV
jgi:hypothetical protein